VLVLLIVIVAVDGLRGGRARIDPPSWRPAAVPTAEQQYMDAVAGVVTVPRDRLLPAGQAACALIPRVPRSEMLRKMRAGYGVAVAEKILAAAQRYLCPYAAFISTAGASPAPAAAAPPSAAESVTETITYEVSGVSHAGNVTFVSANDNVGQEQASNVPLPWSKTITFDAYRYFNFLTIVAQSGSGEQGSITCRILRDEVELASSTSSGPYAVVTCSIS